MPTTPANTETTAQAVAALAPMLDALAAKTPAPGGGAVGPAIAALACAQASMVVAYSLGKKSLADHQDALAEAAAKLARERGLFCELAREDAAAFENLQPYFRLADGDPARAGMAEAAELAASVPSTALAACVNLLRDIEALVPITNQMLASDLTVAAFAAEAAARASACNVRVNLPLLDNERAAALRDQTDRALADARARAEAVDRAVTDGMSP